jgi:hypothetical protein
MSGHQSIDHLKIKIGLFCKKMNEEEIAFESATSSGHLDISSQMCGAF